MVKYFLFEVLGFYLVFEFRNSKFNLVVVGRGRIGMLILDWDFKLRVFGNKVWIWRNDINFKLRNFI